MVSSSREEDWDLVLKPRRGLCDLPIREIVEYKDLILIFIRRDFVIKYKQTVLGPLWYVISPLISAFIYSFIFGRLAGLKTEGVPHVLFYYTGTMMWNFFSNCFMDASNIFVNNSHLFGKVYFPRLVVPISNVAGGAIKLGIQLLCLCLFYVYYVFLGVECRPLVYILTFPFILLWLALLANGTGMIVSSMTTKYRDLRFLVEFAFGLALYASAVVYPIAQLPEQYMWLSYINPVNAPLELTRIIFFGSGHVDFWMLFSSMGQTIVFIFLGLIVFNQNERHFIDVI